MKHSEETKKILAEKTRLFQARKMKDKLETLYRYINEEEIRNLIDAKHSSQMLYDKLLRDCPRYFEESHCAKTVKQLSGILSSVGIHFLSNKITQSTPTWWRAQYKFPKDKSQEELKQFFQEKSRKGQHTVVSVRKKRENYTLQYTTQYWIDKLNCSEEDASQKVLEWKKSISPRCAEFWVKKGLSECEARQVISRNAVDAAVLSLKKCQLPNTEKIIELALQELHISYTKQFRLSPLNENWKGKRKVWVYDFFIPNKNLLIEVQGSYWHADPRIYNSDDVIKFPGEKMILASDIWERDVNKMKSAELQGYNTVAIWELDIKNGLSDAKNLLKDILK